MKTKKDINRETKKEELKNLIKEYTVDDCFDISNFRKDHEKEYRLIPHYFGSINEAMEELHIIKITSGTAKKGNKLTLKDQLAFDMLKELRDKNITFEEISQKYGVSKMLVSKMYKVLGEKIDNKNTAIK